MNVLDVLAHSTLSIELFATQIADDCKLAGMMEHVSLKLCVLNEALGANSANVIATAGMGSHMAIERLFGSKAISAGFALEC